jgi:hypothetical protein
MKDESEKVRWEANASIGCLLLLVLWAWFTGLRTSAFVFVGLCVILGTGIGLGISATRHGSRLSRRVGWIGLRGG